MNQIPQDQREFALEILGLGVGPQTLFQKGLDKGFTQAQGWTYSRCWCLYYNENPARPKYPKYTDELYIKLSPKLSPEEQEQILKLKIQNRQHSIQEGRRGRPSGLSDAHRAVIVPLAQAGAKPSEIMRVAQEVLKTPMTKSMAHYYRAKYGTQTK